MLMLQSDSSPQHASPQSVEEGNLIAAEAGRRYGVPDRNARRWIERYRETGETSRRARTGFWRVSSRAEDARLVDKARENPFLNSVQTKPNTAFPGSPRTVKTTCRRQDLDLEERL
jgi:transposase